MPVSPHATAAAQAAKPHPAAAQPAAIHAPLAGPSWRMFWKANTRHDGMLTIQQVQAAGLDDLVKHFAAVDRHFRGYVTMDDIHAFERAHPDTPLGI